MPTIQIPHDPTAPDKRWKPRHSQRDTWSYLENGGKRAIEIWHRRSGKDELALGWGAVAAHQRVGTYWHLLPEAAQARKVIWDAVDPHRGIRRIDVAFPAQLRESERNHDMFIRFKIGSTWQVGGSDNYNSLVGSPPVGIVFSEWALANPSAWGYMLPIFEDNGGWALFITTPRGQNHAYQMHQSAKKLSDWHTSILTPDDTGLFSIDTLERIRQEYIDLYGEVLGIAMYEQEYWCSFEAPILGAVYGSEMRDARKEGRIGFVPHDDSLPVETWWDIGHDDETAIWFIQRMPGGALHAISYYENRLVGLSHYVKVLQEKQYVYSQHLGPHDAGHRRINQEKGKSVVEMLAELGIKMKAMPRDVTLSTGLSATRPLIKRTRFDEINCADGISALSSYHYPWDQDKKKLGSNPEHDWASNGADAFRTGAHSTPTKKRKRPSVSDLPKVAIV